MNIKKAMSIVAFALAVEAANAFSLYNFFPEALTDSTYISKKLAAPVVLGEWNIGFSKCKTYAEENGVPMFMIWSSTSCSHCTAFDSLFVTDAFKAWCQTNKLGKVVLCFSDNEISGEGENSTAFNWAGGTDDSWSEGQYPWQGYLTAFPFVAFYWPANRIDYHLSGGNLATEWYDEETKLQQIYTAFEKWFAGYDPGGEPNKYGGVFAVGTDEYARLEAQPGLTTEIEVPLVRTNDVDSVGTNWLAYVHNNVTGTYQSVFWSVGQERAYPRLALPDFTKGDTIGLVLATADLEETCDESAVACVTVANSPSNPHWIGEKKTVDDLPFGEWTMDYVLATNKVAQHNAALDKKNSSAADRAYTLLLLEGCLWCGDCANTDSNFLEYEDASGKKPFIEWAKSNNVVLVAFDLPNIRSNTTSGDHPEGEDYPALLKYDAFEKMGATRSGAGYLSRHMISNDVAAATLAEFIETAGVLRRPDWATNPYRPALPTFFIIRDDGTGTVAARLGDFGISGPTEYKECYIDRLNEMLTAVDDPCEEDNALWSTAPEDATVAARGTVTSTLSATDLVDVWYVDAPGQFVKATVSGGKSGTVTVSMYAVGEDGDVSMIADAASGDLADGVSVEGTCPQEGAYLSIVASGTTFSIDSEETTLAEYMLETANVLIPTDTMSSYELVGERTVMVRMETNVVYYLSGVSGPADAEAAASAGYCLYTVPSGSDVEFAVADGASAVMYGIASASMRDFRDAELLAGEFANARLEMEAGATEWVDVPVVSTNGVDENGLTLLVSEFGGSCETQTVEWAAAGSELAFVRVRAPDGIAAGDVVNLTLTTLGGTVVDSGTITCVGAVANSSANPYWFGERTADTLEFGEWTMDISSATGKVAKYNSANPTAKAHAIMVVQGSMWCPNCWKMETNLWDRAEVKAWAIENNVVFGVVDIDPPTFEYAGSYPTLLTYGTEYVSWAAGTDEERFLSGAGYLSRHMAEYDDVLDCRERNTFLVNESVLDGGWCRPERMDKEWKTGLPMIILMRGDGSIAGRYDRFNIEGPDAYAEYLLYRLDELLATADDEHEESNADWRTVGDSEVIHADASATATLSANDRVDTYRLSGTDMRLSVYVSGPVAGDVQISLTALDDIGTNAVELASAIGDLAEGFAVTNEFGSLSNVFIVVTGLDGLDKTFSPLNTNRTTRSYTLVTSALLSPGGTMAEYEADAGVDSVTVSVVEGRVYYFDGISEYDEEVLEKGEGNLYYCKKTAETTLKLAEAGGAMRYCQWESGSFGFTEEEGDDKSRLYLERTVYEEMDGVSKKVPITVHRNGTTFGPASVWVRLLASSTTVTDRYEWVDQKVEWASGVGGDKTVYLTLNDDDVYDPPPQTMVFAIEGDDDSSVEIEDGYGMLVLSIEDDDEIQTGRLAITDASPAWARNMTIVAEEGSQVSFVVTRENGTSGDVTAHLSLKVPGEEPVLSGTMTWENRTRVAERVVTMTVPSYATAKRAVVTIVPGNGIGVDAKRRSAVIQIVEASVPCFAAEDGRLDVVAWTGSSVSETIAVSNLVGYGAVTISKTSGSLPSGVSASYDSSSRSLVISGAPHRTGEWTAVYQVMQERDGRTVKGRTVSVGIYVTAVDASWFEGGELNPVLEETRNYRNVMIVGDDPSGEDTCLRGLLTLSLPKSGRMSAKYVCASGSYSYVADGWDSIDLETGALTATLVCTRSGMSDRTLSVIAAYDGAVTVSMCDVEDPSSTFETAAILTDWSEDSTASAWGGSFNVMLQQNAQIGDVDPGATGHGYMSLRMSDDAAKSGQMKFAGCLPNGRTFSGSSVLLVDDSFGTNARMPFFCGFSGEVLAGAINIVKNANVQHLTSSVNYFVTDVESASPYWAGEADEGDWWTTFTAKGGYYDHDQLCLDCSRRFADGLYLFTGPASTYASAFYGTLGTLSSVEVTMTNGTVMVAAQDANPNNLRLAFSKDTGVYSGTIRLPFSNATVTGTTRGVIIPGWGGCDECGRIGPLGAGALWFTDFLDADGSLPARSGFTVEINTP